MDAQISRLEAVCSRLEALARGKKGGSDGDEDVEPEGFVDFKALYGNQGQAMIKAWETVKHPKAEKVGADLQACFDRVLVILRQELSAKKPEGYNDLAEPIQAAMKAGNKLCGTRNRDLFQNYDNHHKALVEVLQSFFWAWQYPPSLPHSHAKGQLESAMFHLTRIQMKQKSAENDEFVKACKTFLADQAELVKQYYKTGVEFSGTKDLAVDGVATEAAAPEPAAKEEEVVAAKSEPAKKKPEKKSTGGNLFSELNKGLKATAGLKKVQKSQKNKYSGEKIVGVVKGGPKKATSKKKLPDPKKTKRGPFTWFYEYFQEGLTEITEADKLGMKNGIYFATCLNCNFRIIPKIKSVEMDNCNRVQVEVNDLVSSISLVNCKNVTIWCKGKVPTITIDKCESPKVIFLPDCWNHPDGRPQLIYSNVTAGNIEFPGPNPDDDRIEHPLIEQFEVSFGDDSKVTISPMEHSD